MKVLVVAGTNFGYPFWDSFCEYGNKHFDAEFSVMTKSEHTNSQFIKHKKSNVNYYIAGALDIFYPKYGTYRIDKEQLTHELRKFEEESGFLIADIIQADRNLGRGYYHAGHARPVCYFSKTKQYWDTACFIYEYIKYFKSILDDVQPDLLIIEGGCSVESNTLLACVHRQNIPVRRLSTSRYKNLFHWSYSEKEAVPYFEELYKCVPQKIAKTYEVSHGYKMIENITSQKKTSFFGIMKEIFPFTKYRALSFLRKLYKGEHQMLDTYYFQSVWVWFYRDYALTKQLKQINQKQKIQIEPRQYCYFPLHIEPEDTLNVCSPEFNNQVGIIDTLAKNLPAGVVLVVKEHPFGVSTRPKGFYEWLSSIPNVYVASLDLSGPGLAQNSLFTATITGTAGLEAALAGVPVIAFSHNILYTHMNHVRVITDMLELRQTIRKIVNEPQDIEANRLEAQRYLHALTAMSMDFKDETWIRSTPSEEALNLLWSSLQQTLKPLPEIVNELNQKQLELLSAV